MLSLLYNISLTTRYTHRNKESVHLVRGQLIKAEYRQRWCHNAQQLATRYCICSPSDIPLSSIMVWVGIHGNMKTYLLLFRDNLNVQGYVDQVLRPAAVPFRYKTLQICNFYFLALRYSHI